MKNANMPIYPLMDRDSGTVCVAEHAWDPNDPMECIGLTKREELAARAMQGMLSSGQLGQEGEIEDIPHDAVRFADALLAELEQSK